jgi:endonuclease/exonuclease/phosphatase family metal-dependent hydrolase
MKKIIRFILACMLCILSICILYGLSAILYPWLTEYNPDEKTVITETGNSMEKLSTGRTYQILTWNIGYAGLGKEMDFFYEGGKMVRPGREQNEQYLNGILDFLKANDTLDFMLVQEIDFRSKRSHKTDQFKVMGETLGGYHAISATNYKSVFVPSPLMEPMGRVHAGLATFGKFIPVIAHRISTPGSYSWPMRLFMLKRCFLISRYPLENGKDLVLFNIHNSAFDDAAELRDKELELLRKLAGDEYKNGHYVVIGGDWNQNPPGWKPDSAFKYQAKSLWPIDRDYFPPGWTWAYDPGLPTNRDVNQPFDQETTKCTLLDFFLVSPNIRIREVHTIDLEFIHSDHLPVMMEFQLL